MSLLLLVLAELRSSSRSWELRLLLLFALAAGALVGRPALLAAVGDRWVNAWREPAGPDTPEPLCRAGEGEARAVAIDGPPPAWFGWHEPLVELADADVLVRFGAPTTPDPDSRWDGALLIEVFGQHEKAEVDAVASCLRQQVRDERRRRLDGLGVSETPRHVAELRVFDVETGDPVASDLPVPGLSLLVVMVLGALTWAYEALPTARQRGWLETLGTTSVSPALVALSYCVVGGVWAAANGLAFGLGGLISGELPDPRWLLLPLVALTFSALSVRAFITVPDMRASAFRSMWIPLVILALGGAAVGVERGWSLGGLVPIGGLLLPWLGPVSTFSSVTGPVLALPTAALAAASAGAVLVRDGALGQGGDPAEARRARGDYRPEALLLMLLALAGLGVVVAPIGGGPAVQLAVGQLLFLIAPALVAPGLLGLSTRETLGLVAPSPRAWVALPGVLLGTLSGGLLATVIQARILPDNPFQMADYGGAVDSFTVGLAVLVPTLGAGLSEELLFRGAIQGLLLRRGRWPVALLLQALGFALLHVLAFKLLPTGVIGLLLGLFAWRSRSVWPGVVTHVLHNAIALLVAPMLLSLFDPTQWPAWGPAAAAGLCVLGGVAAWWSGEPGRDKVGT